MADDVPACEKSRRLDVLQRRQREITLDNNTRRVGSTFEVLVDGPSSRHKGQVHGRTTHNAIVNFDGDIPRGASVTVRITHANPNSLTGELVR
jgi:tRNA-2-methylthio-N6-dimethylallyladenosine synthase